MAAKIRTLVPSFILVILLYWAFHSYKPTSIAPQSNEPPWSTFNSTAPLPTSDYAIATFLTGWFGDRNDDTYLNATRVMAYQLLHAQDTRIESPSISFLVLCTSTVPVWMKQRLISDGVTVVDVKDVPVNWWIRTSVRRWKEQFTKLRLVEMTQYKRVLFIDADTMIMRRLDKVFEEPEVANLAPAQTSRNEELKEDEGDLPQEWTFVAPSDNGWAGQRDHPIPPFQTLRFSAGFWIVAPDHKLFAHCLAVMSHWKRFDPYQMEQSLLNYVFRREGPMPWRELGWKWNAQWPSEKDEEAGVATLHEKWWKEGPDKLQNRWNALKSEMEKFHGEQRTE